MEWDRLSTNIHGVIGDKVLRGNEALGEGHEGPRGMRLGCGKEDFALGEVVQESLL